MARAAAARHPGGMSNDKPNAITVDAQHPPIDPITSPCQLTRLSPQWIGAEASPTGLRFRCPCEACAGNGADIEVTFAGPDDVTNLRFDVLSIVSPIDCSSSGHWSGRITSGLVA